MRINLGFGGEVDVVTKDEMTDVTDGFLDGMKKTFPRRRKPLIRRIPASGVMPAVGPGPLVLSFGNVPPGYTFELTHAVVMGSDDRTAVANSLCALYIGNSQNPSLGDLAQPAITAPGYWNIGTGTLFAHIGSEVFILVYGAAAGSNLAATLSVLQHIEDTAEAGAI